MSLVFIYASLSQQLAGKLVDSLSRYSYKMTCYCYMLTDVILTKQQNKAVVKVAEDVFKVYTTGSMIK